MSEIVRTYKGKVIIKKEEGLVIGDLPAVEVPMKSVALEWTGSKVPSKLLRQTVNFARYVFRKYGGEVQWRMMHNEESDEWAVVVCKQWISHGMTSKEVGAEGDIEEAMKQLKGTGWTYNGTGHSHCDIDAFMSGTDRADEENQTGFHYTVGHLNDDRYDLHSRYSFRGLLYIHEDEECMFEKPNRSMKRLPRFPSQWLDMLVERPAITVSTKKSKTSVRGAASDEWWEKYEKRCKSMDHGYDPHQDKYLDSRPVITEAEYLSLAGHLTCLFEGFDMQDILAEMYVMHYKTQRKTKEVQTAMDFCIVCGENGPTDVEGLCDNCAGVYQYMGGGR